MLFFGSTIDSFVMDIPRLRGERFLRPLLALVILVVLCPGAWGKPQDQAAPPAQQQQNQNQDQDQKQSDKSVRPTQADPTQASPEQTQKPAGGDASATKSDAGATKPDAGAAKPEVKITAREAQELFHSVDEILAFDSKQTGLPIKKQVKRRLTSRDEVVGYLTKHMKDEDVKRLQRSELVLKKFGLLPRDYDLEKLLVALLREQVAGYYDPKTKTVNLLDWVPMEEQEPVMAHELTHALQDQTVGLDKWMKKGDKDLGEIRRASCRERVLDHV